MYQYYKRGENGDLQVLGEVMENPESIGTYGIYAGSGCITYCGGDDGDNGFVGQADETDYYFNQAPIDQMDAIAQKHDKTQSEISNYQGHFDKRTLQSDKDFVKETKQYLKNTKDKNFVDPYTGRPPSSQAIRNTRLALVYFRLIELPAKRVQNIGNGGLQSINKGAGKTPSVTVEPVETETIKE